MECNKKCHKINGTLRFNPSNSHYFTDDSGRAVYLTGSHTWANFQDMLDEQAIRLDYNAYLDLLSKNNHNFIRLWMWEQATWVPWSEDVIAIEPVPYARTGSGTSPDGKPKFDLDQWDESFFARLRSRIIQAGEMGIYVSIMLFQGWSIKKSWLDGDPWRGHPYNVNNNINGVDGDTTGDGLSDIHSLEIPGIVARQEAFVEKIINTVNDLDNVLYEIINEPDSGYRTLEWEHHIIDLIHTIEVTKPKQHPVGLTPIGHTQENRLMFDSKAEWISVGQGEREEYKNNPPEADGSKVILLDTDHIWGLGGDYKWVWMSFTRGMNVILMDPWLQQPKLDDAKNDNTLKEWELMRRTMGYTLNYACRMDLNTAIPHGELASSTFCLANPGIEYLVYGTEDRDVTVDLTTASGKFAVEWLNPITGDITSGNIIEGGTIIKLSSPFGDNVVLYIYAED